MNVTIHVDSHVDVKKLVDRVMNDRGLWIYAASEWHMLYEPYVPMDTGVLKDTVRIRPKEVEHTVPYAQYIYYGEKLNFRRDMHPKASTKWDLAARATQEPKLYSSLQQYIDSGRLKLD